MKNDKSINVRISEELYNAIAADAKAQELSLNEIVRRVLQAKWNNLEQNPPNNSWNNLEQNHYTTFCSTLEQINTRLQNLEGYLKSPVFLEQFGTKSNTNILVPKMEQNSPEQNKPQDEPKTPNESGSTLNQNSYDCFFDEFDFLLMGPKDIRRQIINNNFSRDTIKWNENVFTGKHEDQYNYKRLIDTPKSLDRELAILGEQDWNRWKAAISCMPASNDIVPLPLPKNPKHQWMYIFLAAGPHISSREAFCGLIKQAYKQTNDEMWKKPGNIIATLEPFTYAAAMEIIWPTLMTDRYMGDE